MDISAPDDGRVVICVSSLELGEKATLTIKDPTVIYLTGTTGDGVALLNKGEIQVATQVQKQPGRGLMVVAAPTVSSRVWTLRAGKFEGSIYTPAATIELFAQLDDEARIVERGDNPDRIKPPVRQLGFVVGNWIRFGRVKLDFTGNHTSSKSQSTTPLSVVSWTQ